MRTASVPGGLSKSERVCRLAWPIDAPCTITLFDTALYGDGHLLRSRCRASRCGDCVTRSDICSTSRLQPGAASWPGLSVSWTRVDVEAGSSIPDGGAGCDGWAAYRDHGVSFTSHAAPADAFGVTGLYVSGRSISSPATTGRRKWAWHRSCRSIDASTESNCSTPEPGFRCQL